MDDIKNDDVKELIEEGKFYFLNQKYNEALQYLNKALEKDPENIEVLYTIGIIYESINNPDKALEYFKKVIKIDPQHEDAIIHIHSISENQ
ncbi:tetratricopeptide repeat protein [candidate division WOR-3 bacterium]|nr:tetratricopeptide repeat protein [candidate division WOR-3 bacterium]